MAEDRVTLEERLKYRRLQLSNALSLMDSYRREVAKLADEIEQIEADLGLLPA